MSTKKVIKSYNFFWKLGNDKYTIQKRKDENLTMSKHNKKPSERAINKINRKSEEIAEIWSGNIDNNEEITSDVLGSYTGNPIDTDRPIQDADDL